jgi:hypothetical protein
MEASVPACLPGDLELGSPLEAVAARGWAHLPAALAPGFVTALQREIEAGPFEAGEREVGQVHQELGGYVVAAGDPDRPLTERLRRELGARIRAEGAGIEGLAGFDPNEVHVQRYPSAGVGITPHRDGTRFRRLIAVATTRGRARFSVHAERHAPPTAAWQVGPGDLVLLRGPGLGGVEDGRPLHAVGGSLGDETRYSVSVRHNARTASGHG